MSNENWNKDIHKDFQSLITEVKAVSKEIKKLTRVLDKNADLETPATLPMDGMELEPSRALSAWVAIKTLSEYCAGIQHCNRDNCEIYDWCLQHIGDGTLENSYMEGS